MAILCVAAAASLHRAPPFHDPKKHRTGIAEHTSASIRPPGAAGEECDGAMRATALFRNRAPAHVKTRMALSRRATRGTLSPTSELPGHRRLASDNPVDPLMLNTLKALIKQPYWIITLILGVGMIALPCITLDSGNRPTTHPPTTWLLVIVGIVLLLVSIAAFAYIQYSTHKNAANGGDGTLDMSSVKQEGDALYTCVNDCEIRVVSGRIQDFPHDENLALVLPCNEYFDDRCINDTKSALGAYANKTFDGQLPAFQQLMASECRRKFGAGQPQQKTSDERAQSFGAGRCLLLHKPLDRRIVIALISTTTQRENEGLSSRISYLFNGIGELVMRVADTRINEVAMPLLGSGHGGISAPLAFVSMLLALAEAARYGQGSQRLKKATIILYRKDSSSTTSIDTLTIRRALALIGSQR
jgi:hypothetical protein